MKADQFQPLEIKKLLKWILHDHPHGSCLGIDGSSFFIPKDDDRFRMKRYGMTLETPLGVAAGPHTQLAQNIVAAWLCGARYIELKTVQVLDELDVTKPCIAMHDEGYNCEWSQELQLEASFQEYCKAYLLIMVLRDVLGLPATLPDGSVGFIFNMSVGYTLEGIMSPPMQVFLDKMHDVKSTLQALQNEIAPLYPRVKNMPMPSCLSNNLTLSTMHGCPPDEIEKIGRYFLEERGLHTSIKLNPTLLGAEALRGILNTDLNYDTVIPDEAFAHDPSYADACTIIRNLQKTATKCGLDFGLKLTNTLESCNTHQDLPKSESMVYMSGRALHAISINVANALQHDFTPMLSPDLRGTLDISFSAGVDSENIVDVLACGLYPVTVCSDILKPGGYARLNQYLTNIQQSMRAKDIPDLATLSANALTHLLAYSKTVHQADSRYAKEQFHYAGVKHPRPLPRFDCATAPCMQACPTAQYIPRYLEATAKGDFAKAWHIILATNPFPNTQGMICDHQCQNYCTRQNIDKPLMIREIKRFISTWAATHPDEIKRKSFTITPKKRSVAIIGGGPSGLSAAHFLALHALDVTVYEATDTLGGMAACAIPSFRLDPQGLARDIDAILALGITTHMNTPVDKTLFAKLCATHDAVYVATGAKTALRLNIEGEDALGVLNQLDFLAQVHAKSPMNLGDTVLVIGAGNAAMDVARTALRIVKTTNPLATVSLVYRRSIKEMPAEYEELACAFEEGIHVLPLLAPERIITEKAQNQAESAHVTGLLVNEMKLVDNEMEGVDGKGKAARKRPVRIEGATRILPATSIIVAIGQSSDLSFMGEISCKADPHTQCTEHAKVYIGGDSRRGASSLIHAVGDGQSVCYSILQSFGIPAHDFSPADDREHNTQTLGQRQTRRMYPPKIPTESVEKRMHLSCYSKAFTDNAAKQEAHRCLQCDVACSVCVTVCPNRANIALPTPYTSYPRQSATQDATGVHIITHQHSPLQNTVQIINIADLCNACGNCATFCPSSGRPYVDKPRFHLSASAFEQFQDGYYLADKNTLETFLHGHKTRLVKEHEVYRYTSQHVEIMLDTCSLLAKEVRFLEKHSYADISPAVELAIIYALVATAPPFVQN